MKLTLLVILLKRVLLWLDPPPPPAPDSPLRLRAKILTQMAETYQESGEAKRHRVYGRLLKEFPNVKKRLIALTIEEVLNNVHPSPRPDGL